MYSANPCLGTKRLFSFFRSKTLLSSNLDQLIINYIICAGSKNVTWNVSVKVCRYQPAIYAVMEQMLLEWRPLWFYLDAWHILTDGAIWNLLLGEANLS